MSLSKLPKLLLSREKLDWSDVEVIEKKIKEVNDEINKGEDVCGTLISYREKRCCVNQEYMFFCLAVCCMNPGVSKKAYEALIPLCKTGGNILKFISIHQKLIYRDKEKKKKSIGWNYERRRGVLAWYMHEDSERLLYCLTKYRSGHGWSHKDVLKYIHAKVPNNDSDINAKKLVLTYICKGYKKVKDSYAELNPKTETSSKVIRLIDELEDVKALRNEEDLLQFIEKRKPKMEFGSPSKDWSKKADVCDKGNTIALVDNIRHESFIGCPGRREAFQMVPCFPKMKLSEKVWY